MRRYFTAALIAVFLCLPSCDADDRKQRKYEAALVPSGAKIIWRDTKDSYGTTWLIFQFGDKRYLLRTGRVTSGVAEYEGPIPPTAKGE